MRMNVQITETGPIALRQRDLNELIADAYADIALFWHKHFRKRHFTHYGAALYGYAARSIGYLKLKRRKFGHNLPLVLTGTSRQLSESYQINATKNGVTLTMPVRAFNFKTRNSRVDMRREFTTVAAIEQAELEARAQKRLEQKYQSASRSLTRRAA